MDAKIESKDPLIVIGEYDQIQQLKELVKDSI